MSVYGMADREVQPQRRIVAVSEKELKEDKVRSNLQYCVKEEVQYKSQEHKLTIHMRRVKLPTTTAQTRKRSKIIGILVLATLSK